MSALLEVQALTVRYGGLVAVDRVDLAVSAGEVAGLIGPNGAGKTTLIDAVTGFVARSDGSTRFAGTVVDGLPPHARARAGLARTFQGGGLFDDLSVQDNLLVAAAPSTWQDIAADALRPWRRRTRIDAVERSLDLFGLLAEREVKVRELPHGTRRLVGIARALAARPRLLLLDEPAAGLDSQESRRLGQSIRRLADDGLAVLLVEHDVDLVFRICDTVHVLDVGAVIARGSPDAVRRNRLVIEAYLGSHSRDRQREPDPGGSR